MPFLTRAARLRSGGGRCSTVGGTRGNLEPAPRSPIRIRRSLGWSDDVVHMAETVRKSLKIVRWGLTAGSLLDVGRLSYQGRPLSSAEPCLWCLVIISPAFALWLHRKCELLSRHFLYRCCGDEALQSFSISICGKFEIFDRQLVGAIHDIRMVPG